MTAAQQAKHYGCKSLAEVSRQSGISIQTLYNWHKIRPACYRLVCLGVVADRDSQTTTYSV